MRILRFISGTCLAGLLCGLAVIGSADGVVAQIVPETSGKASAANSPAAIVQTGSRRRLTNCHPCYGQEATPDDRRPRATATR